MVDNFAALFNLTPMHLVLDYMMPKGSAVAWWLMPRTPDQKVGVSSPTRVKPCFVLEQGTFTLQKVLVIPRKRRLRPNMTEKLFTWTLRINQPTIYDDPDLKLFILLGLERTSFICYFFWVSQIPLPIVLK